MTTLSNTVERLVGEGFTANFGVVGGKLRAYDSGKTFGAHEVIIREYERFEGVSDPDDMAIVYAIESLDGTRGSLADAFGVYSNPLNLRQASTTGGNAWDRVILRVRGVDALHRDLVGKALRPPKLRMLNGENATLSSRTHGES